MSKVILLLIIICIALISWSIILTTKITNIRNNSNKIWDEKINSYVTYKTAKANDEIKRVQDRTNIQIGQLNTTIQKNVQIIQSQKDQQKTIIEQGQQIIDQQLKQYETEEKIKIDNALSDYIKEQEKEKQQIIDETNQLYLEVVEYRKKRDAINQAIMREKEIQEKEDFYRVVIDKSSQDDIEILKEIAPKLKNKHALNKLIYDVFIKLPAGEMIKRVLNGKEPSGIYRITYIPTGESYIGKSTNIKNRWTNHIKTACGLEGAASTSLHKKMELKGVWNFTWELLEEVEKSNLSAREKYYIDLYDTKNNGLNIKNG